MKSLPLLWLVAGACMGRTPPSGDDSPCALTVYSDQDGDGYGAAEVGAGCSAGAGESLVGGDCDDGDAVAFPGAEELCGGALDEDCDGLVDEGLSTSLWYADVDGDGYGVEPGEARCEGLSGEVSEGGDCADDDAGVYPGAPELLGDGVDGDCDGEVDQLPAALWSCAGPCEVSWLGGSEQLVLGDGAAGEAWLLGVSAEGLSEQGSATGPSGFGASVAGLGEGSWAVGSPDEDEGVARVYVSTRLEASVYGESLYTTLGLGLGGSAEALVVQATFASSLSAVLLFVDPSGELDASDFDAQVNGFGRTEQPFALALVALDGDGLADDLVLGAPEQSNGSGAVYVYADLDLADGGDFNADDGTRLSGSGGEALGLAVSVGDLDGDGGVELALGGGAAVYLFDAAPAQDDRVDRLADATLSDTPSAPSLSAADLDGDGALELLVGGAPEALVMLPSWPSGSLSLRDDADQLSRFPTQDGALPATHLAGHPTLSALALTTDGGLAIAWGAP